FRRDGRRRARLRARGAPRGAIRARVARLDREGLLERRHERQRRPDYEHLLAVRTVRLGEDGDIRRAREDSEHAGRLAGVVPQPVWYERRDNGGFAGVQRPLLRADRRLDLALDDEQELLGAVRVLAEPAARDELDPDDREPGRPLGARDRKGGAQTGAA